MEGCIPTKWICENIIEDALGAETKQVKYGAKIN